MATVKSFCGADAAAATSAEVKAMTKARLFLQNSRAKKMGVSVSFTSALVSLFNQIMQTPLSDLQPSILLSQLTYLKQVFSSRLPTSKPIRKHL